MVRFTTLIVLACTVLLISSVPLASLMGNTERKAEVTEFHKIKNHREHPTGLTGDQVNTGGDFIITKRSPSPDEMEGLKARVGVWQEGADYNPTVDGHGTGLKPPTEEEWGNIGREIRVIDDIAPPVDGPIGASVDHFSSNYFPPIGNQDGEGSCVAWAVGYYTKTFQEAKEHNWDISGATWDNGYYGYPTIAYQDKIMSPDFIYHQINDGLDEGSYYSSAMDVCNRIGVSSWKKMPYDPNDSTTWPSEEAWREAPWYRTDQGYNYMYTYPPYNADGITDLKNWLDGGQLAIISIRANEYSNLDASDLWKNDTYSDAAGTNHANTIIGYDDNFGPYTEDGQSRTGAFKVANQWGTGWTGDSNNDGMFWISYECMKWDVEYCFLFDDKIAYEPELLSVFEMTHTKRGECNISLGLGSKGSPTSIKRFDDWYDNFDGGAQAFPNNKMIVDITEYVGDVPSINGSQLFIEVNDTETATVGSIDSFYVEYYDDYRNGSLMIKVQSPDPTVNTVQNTPVYAVLNLTDDISPLADAGSDQTVENGTKVVFNGSGSSDLSGIKNYTWNFSYDQGARTIYGATPNYTFNIYGNYNVTLNVTDPSGNWDLDNLSVSVADLTDPVADAGVDQGIGQGQTVTFDGSGSSDNEGIDNYTWNFTYDGLERSLYDVSPFFTFEIVGSYNVTLNVTDTAGNFDMDNMTVTVSDTEKPVFGTLWHNTLNPGDPAFFSANITDNVNVSTVMFDFTINGTARYNWSVTNKTGSSWEINFTLSSNTTLIEFYFSAGDDANNWEKSNNDTFAVNDNQNPVFGAMWAGTLTTGDAAFFSANVTDNVGVNSVMFDFTINGADRYNWSVTNKTGNSWDISIPLPKDAATLEYYFWAQDGAANWAATSNATPAVSDNDPPVFGTVSNGVLTTGENAWFSANLTDNRGINTVKFAYTVNTNLHENVSVTNQTGEEWLITIHVPSDTANFEFFFWSDDANSNEEKTNNATPAAGDNDRPVFGTISNSGLTTGENAWFSANITDNIGVNGVKLAYTVNGIIHENVSVTNQTGEEWLITIHIPVDTVNFEFFFWAEDAAGNGESTGNSSTAASDNDKPVFGAGWTSVLTTGDSAYISTNITDNIGVTNVMFDFTVNGDERHNWSVTNNSGSIWDIAISIPGDAASFEYHFWARDAAGNREKGGNSTPAVSDNDRPVFGSVWATSLATGDIAFFSANITDNVGVNAVRFDFTVDGNDRYNWSVTNNSGDSWNITITLPARTVTFEYHFWAADAAGNSRTDNNATPGVSDNDKPSFGTTWTNALTTGDAAFFSANITDNRAISTVMFDITINGAVHSNLSVTNLTGDSWSITVALPEDAVTVEFYFWSQDQSGNWEKGALGTPTVSDNDKPTFGAGWTNSLTTGDAGYFSVNTTDNLGVAAVTLDFTINGASSFNWAVTNNTGDSWSILINIPPDATSIEYYFTATDAASNLERNGNSTLSVVDNDAPFANAGDNISIDQHVTVIFNGSASSDNIGIANYTWKLTYDWNVYSLYNVSPSFIFHTVGTYTVTLNVTDGEGFWNITSIRITVLDITPPTAEAGVNRTIDQHVELLFDSVGCGDNVEIENYTWNFTYGGICQRLYGASPSFIFHMAGNITINLRVYDLAGNMGQDNFTLNVRDITLPTAVAGADLVVDQHTLVILNGSGSHDNVGIVNFTWNFTDNENITLLYEKVAEYLFHNAGTFNITLRVEDSMGNFYTDNLTLVVNDTTRPTADAGPDITIDQNEEAHFNGGGSSDNYGIMKYIWTVHLENETEVLSGMTANYLFHRTGIFVVELTVRDFRGNEDHDNLTVSVNDTTYPVASPGKDITVRQHETVTFNGSGSSDNGGIALYTWIIAREQATRSTVGEQVYLYGEIAEYTFHDAGIYTVTLIVTDISGNNATEALTVNVEDITPPRANAGEDVVIEQHRKVEFDAGGSQDNLGIIKYSWSFFYENADAILDGVAPSFIFHTAGRYLVTLNVIDAAGYWHSDTLTVDVIDVTRPDVNAGVNITINQHESIHFFNHSSWKDDGETILSCKWSFTYDGRSMILHWGPELSTPPEHTTAFVFDIPGRYEVTLNVTDVAGNWATDSLTVTVTDTIPPTPEAGEDREGKIGGEIPFDGTKSFDDVEITNYTWTFNYGGREVKLYGSDPSFKFEREGNYQVTLTVTDGSGNSLEDTMYVNITDPRAAKGEEGTGKWMEKGGIWIVGTFLLILVILVLFFIVRRRKPRKEPVKDRKKVVPAAARKKREKEPVLGPTGPVMTKRKDRMKDGKGKGREKSKRREARAAAEARRKKKIQMEKERRRRAKYAGRGPSTRTSTFKRSEMRESKRSGEADKEEDGEENIRDAWDEDEWEKKISHYGEVEEHEIFTGYGEEDGEYEPDWADDDEDDDVEEFEYECPECGGELGEDDGKCARCGAEFLDEERHDEEGGWVDEPSEEEGSDEEDTFEDRGSVGGRYGEEEVDFIIDMEYVDFDEEDFDFLCPECDASIGGKDTSCAECDTIFEEGFEAEDSIWETDDNVGIWETDEGEEGEVEKEDDDEEDGSGGWAETWDDEEEDGWAESWDE